jgi:hypothetical protein
MPRRFVGRSIAKEELSFPFRDRFELEDEALYEAGSNILWWQNGM